MNFLRVLISFLSNLDKTNLFTLSFIFFMTWGVCLLLPFNKFIFIPFTLKYDEKDKLNDILSKNEYIFIKKV